MLENTSVMIEKEEILRIIMSHIKFDYSKVLDKFVTPHEGTCVACRRIDL